jgi:hypothetical protein
MKKINLKILTLCLILLIAVASRILPHPNNFAPMGAMALFGAAFFDRKYFGIFFPILAIWISDLFINNVIYAKYYPTFTWFYDGFYWQYGTYILIGLFGVFLLKKVTLHRLLIGSLTSSLIFFLITNLACWSNNPMYSQDMIGVLDCYIMGLPFLKGTIMGDLFYSTVLFTSFILIQYQVPKLKKQIA